MPMSLVTGIKNMYVIGILVLAEGVVPLGAPGHLLPYYKGALPKLYSHNWKERQTSAITASRRTISL